MLERERWSTRHEWPERLLVAETASVSKSQMKRRGSRVSEKACTKRKPRFRT